MLGDHLKDIIRTISFMYCSQIIILLVQYDKGSKLIPSETICGKASGPCMVSSMSENGLTKNVSTYNVIPIDHISSSGPAYLEQFAAYLKVK